jgi:hypothetical protein
MELVSKLAASGDYVSLPHADAYATYYNQIARAFSLVQRWSHEHLAADSPDAVLLALFLDRLLQSIELLRLRYRYARDSALRLDLNASGLPHSTELVRLAMEAETVQEWKARLPPASLLKEQALDALFASQDLPHEQLQQLATWHYLDALPGARFMGPYFFAGLRSVGTQGKRTRHVAAWACYDSEENLPAFYLLEFEFSGRERDLAEGAEFHRDFLARIERETRHQPPLAVLATALDEAFDTVHPKALRRLRLGPFIFPRFSFDEDALAELLRTRGDPDDFALSVTSEVIVSSRELVKEKAGLFRPAKVRELFKIAEGDLACWDRKLSALARFRFLPHRLWQVLATEKDHPAHALNRGHQRLAFNSRDEIFPL